jgi:hypothetical protein
MSSVGLELVVVVGRVGIGLRRTSFEGISSSNAFDATVGLPASEDDPTRTPRHLWLVRESGRGDVWGKLGADPTVRTCHHPSPDAAVPDRLISALRIPDLALVRGGWHSWHRIDGEIHSRQRSNSCGQALQTSRIPIQHLEISIRKSKKTIQGSRISFSFAKPAMQRATSLTTWSQRRGIPDVHHRHGDDPLACPCPRRHQSMWHCFRTI